MKKTVKLIFSERTAACVISACALVAQVGYAQSDSGFKGDATTRIQSVEITRLRAQSSTLLERDLLAQRSAWNRDEIAEHGEPTRAQESEPGMRRRVNGACNYLGYWPVNLANPRYPNPTVIHSSVIRRRTVCPDWIPPSALRQDKHEAKGTVRSPAQLLPFSPEVITVLDKAHARFPDDDWFLRQLVRVLVENGKTGDARRVTTGCNSKRFWCLASQAYASFAAGQAVQAQRAFGLAMATLSQEERCDWELRPEFATVIDSVSNRTAWCAQRYGLSVNSWWLGNPFYSDSVNWRHLEHYVRRVRTEIAADLRLEPFFDMRKSKGADAIVAMYLRYGAPSHMVYMGAKHEQLHSIVNKQADSAPPYPAPEYSMDRVATLPALRAALAPKTVNDEDFQFVAPDSVVPYSWWPTEHLRLAGGGTIERLAHHQRALLRRDSTTLLVLASELRGGRLDSIGTTPVQAALVFTPTVDSIAVLGQQTTTRGSTVVMHGEFASPGVVGFEALVNAHGLAGSRTRFGIEHLPTLAAMIVGTCAISDPMLTRADALAGNGTADAFTGLLGSLTLDKPTRLGLVWESYGFAPNDTTRIAVQIVSANEVSKLRRLGMVLGVADDPTTSVTIRWEEPKAPAARAVIPTRTPTIARQLALNIERLRAGDYVLAIAMEKDGCELVRSERPFRVQR